jgi:mRNA-degrading endonuclease toxin of MazEF toxin-antitoxin module
MKQYEVVQVNLDPTIGSEIKKNKALYNCIPKRNE